MPGLLLGLSMGPMCLASCGPVLFPLMVSQSGLLSRHALLVVQFLLGRLVGYVLVGLIAGWAGSVVNLSAKPFMVFIGILYVLLAGSLLVYGFRRTQSQHCVKQAAWFRSGRVGRFVPNLLVSAFGLISGLNLCPPFLLAITESIRTGSVSSSLFFFVMFFVGTSLYFLPVPLISLFSKSSFVQLVARMGLMLVGAYYIFVGLFLLYENLGVV